MKMKRRVWPFVWREHDHDWFPDLGPREFIPTEDVCLKCSAERVLLPWGKCLGGHPIHEHYDHEGIPRPLTYCGGPQ